jgi:hypothetical protein
MIMKKLAATLFGLGLAGLAMNAHALCVNPDGSLDDSSVPPGSVVMDMLPACDAAAAPTGKEMAAVSNDKHAVAPKALDASQPKKLDRKS